MERTDLFTLIRSGQPLTEKDLQDLCEGVTGSVSYGSASFGDVIHTRASIELIRAIWRFDEASAKMVKRGNRINAWVLTFAIVAALLAGASIWVAWMSYQLALAQVGK
jgi:hypothetical protein